MRKLADSIESNEELRRFLTDKANHHRRYKTYGSMERLQNCISTSSFYLSSGSRWNDTLDREQMKDPCLFGMCFSFAETENVAMWMLYGSEGGKKGGMLDFSGKSLRSIINKGAVYLGKFGTTGFEDLQAVPEAKAELIDIVYYSRTLNGKYRISHVDDHVTVKTDILDGGSTVMKKSFPWHYEKECRLLVRIPEEYKAFILEQNIQNIRIQWPAVKTADWVCYRSPVYQGEAPENTRVSGLYGEVEWDLK